MVNETIKYEYEENNDVYVVEIKETGAERTVDGITVRETFELFEEFTNEWTDEMLEDVELIREIIDVMVAFRIKEYEVKLALMVYGILPINPKTNFKDNNEDNNNYKGDKMVKVYRDEDLNTMTDEQYDNLGCIYEATTEEEKDTMYNNQSEVIMALINTFKVDLRSTEAYEKLINEAKRSTTPINTNQFYDVLYNQLFEWDCPMIDLSKNIQIECVTEDASFDYDYGSISSVHHCSIIIGYNIKIEDID